MKHLFAKKWHPYTLLALMGIFFLLSSYSQVQAYTETFKATGWQSLTQNDLEAARLAALDDALQKAVSLAVMAHRPETLTGPKSQVMMANVLSRRNELIESYRVVSEEATQARYRMTVTADIRIDQLTTLLKKPTVSEPVPPPAIHTKIAIFIHENRSGQGAPVKSVGAVLADQLKQAGFTVALQNSSPSVFAMTDVFMQTSLFGHQALALGRQHQADKVVMGVAKINGTSGRLSATLFDMAKGEAAATIKSTIPVAETAALQLKLGTDAARQVLENLKSVQPQTDTPFAQAILVKVATNGNLQRLVALRRSIRQLVGVEQVQMVEMTTDTTILSVLGAISVQRLLNEITQLPMVASVEHASQGSGDNQIDVVLSRY